MKIGNKSALIVMVVLIAGIMASCTSTGDYMPLSRDDVVIGTVQTTFEVRSFAFFWKTKSSMDAVNRQAYIKLSETANQKYQGNIDIRDILWVTGRMVNSEYTEISASGKVVQVQ